MIDYIAHGRKENGELQSVLDHANRVAALAKAYGDEIGLGSCGRLAGLLHDMGKLTDQFQGYIKGVLGLQTNDVESGGDHAMYGAAYIYKHYHDNNYQKKDQKKNQLYAKISVEILAMVICYHHGGMEDFVHERDIRLLDRINNALPVLNKKEEEWMKYLGCKEETIQSLFEQCSQEIAALIDKMKIITDYKSENWSFMLHMLIKYLYSCLIDADRTDTAAFMSDYAVREIKCQQIIEKETTKYQGIWMEIDSKLSLYEKELHIKKSSSPGMAEINKWRKRIWEDCRDAGQYTPGIYTLTVPTGGGKTLSSFRFAVNHALAYEKKRIIYILPYISIIEQNAKVIHDIIDHDDWLLEHHCNVIADDFSDEELESRELMTESWDVPVIFSTLVQFLNIFYSASTQYTRRMHNLANSVIIFDEIQAIPVKCISMFNETVNFLSGICGCTVVLCSATQPTFSQLERHKIKVQKEIIRNMKENFLRFKRMQILDQCKGQKMEFGELIEFSRKVIAGEESVLIVMNTKKMALKIYKSLIGDNLEGCKIYYLSTNLCPTHRRNIIAELKDELSNENRMEKIICVSTQLIEAGVDISFSCVIRHLSGLDSIAQSSGRGNRNGEKEMGKTYIVQCLEEKLGSLKEIELGKTYTKVMLDQYERNPQKYDNDLLSPSAISEYFDYYYHEISQGKNMDYKLKESYKTIYEMLSLSGQRNIYKSLTGKDCPLVLDYQIRTAARNFAVIDENTKSVLVPYQKGKDLIAKLESCQYGIPERRLLREVQQYSINLYETDFNALIRDGGIEAHEHTGIYILKERYYNSFIGLVTEGFSRMETSIL